MTPELHPDGGLHLSSHKMNEALDKMEKILEAATHDMEVVPSVTKKTSEEVTTFVRLDKSKEEEPAEEKKKGEVAKPQRVSDDENEDSNYETGSKPQDYSRQEEPDWGYEGPWHPPHPRGNYHQGSHGRPWGHSRHCGGYQRPHCGRRWC